MSSESRSAARGNEIRSGDLTERVTLRLSERVLAPYEAAVERGEFTHLSEALRAGLRDGRG